MVCFQEHGSVEAELGGRRGGGLVPRGQVEQIIDDVVAAGMCDQVLVAFYRKNQ
jgi:hypothetical protein